MSYCSTIKEETRATFTEFNLASDLSGGLQRNSLTERFILEAWIACWMVAIEETSGVQVDRVSSNAGLPYLP